MVDWITRKLARHRAGYNIGIVMQAIDINNYIITGCLKYVGRFISSNVVYPNYFKSMGLVLACFMVGRMERKGMGLDVIMLVVKDGIVVEGYNLCF